MVYCRRFLDYDQLMNIRSLVTLLVSLLIHLLLLILLVKGFTSTQWVENNSQASMSVAHNNTPTELVDKQAVQQMVATIKSRQQHQQQVRQHQQQTIEEQQQHLSLQQRRLEQTQQRLEKFQQKTQQQQLQLQRLQAAEKARQRIAAQHKLQQQAQQQLLAATMRRYKQLITAKIYPNWKLPISTENLKVTCHIYLSSDGTVLNVSITHTSGNAAVDRSAIAAIYRSSPLPIPKNQSLANAFSEIELTLTRS